MPVSLTEIRDILLPGLVEWFAEDAKYYEKMKILWEANNEISIKPVAVFSLTELNQAQDFIDSLEHVP